MVIDIVTRAETKTTYYRRMPALFPVQEVAPIDPAHAAAVAALKAGPIDDIGELEELLLDFCCTQRGIEAANPSDGDKQRVCDEAHGHVLKVEGNDITCTTG